MNLGRATVTWGRATVKDRPCSGYGWRWVKGFADGRTGRMEQHGDREGSPVQWYGALLTAGIRGWRGAAHSGVTRDDMVYMPVLGVAISGCSILILFFKLDNF